MSAREPAPTLAHGHDGTGERLEGGPEGPRFPDEGRPDFGGLWLAAGYLVGWIPVFVLINLVVVLMLVGHFVVLHGAAGAGQALVESVAGDASAIPAWILVATLAIQFPAMVALVPVVQWAVDRLWYRDRAGSSRPEGWGPVWALRPASRAAWVLGGVLGLTAGIFPGWIAEQLRSLLPFDLGALDMIQSALTEGWWPWQVGMALGVAVGAPLAEEFVFRGFLWDALERWLPPVGVWIGTSLVFAAYHMDPVQGLALIPTALVLGWVRWQGGSIWPCVLLHAVNNSLGVAAAHLASSGAEAESSLPFALGALTVTVSLCGALWVLTRDDTTP